MENTIRTKRELILTGNTYKAIITLALPLMIGNVIQTLYNLTDAYWVGKLGYIEFTSIGFVFPIIMVFLAFSIGLTISATSLISQSVGEDNIDKANKIAGQFFIISVVGGIFLSIIGILLTPTVIALMGATGKLYEYSVSYLQIILLEIPILFIFHVYKSMREGQGDTVKPTLIIAISAIINIVLDPFFILVLGWGVQGAAIATVLSKVSILWYIIYKMIGDKNGVHINFKALKIEWKFIKNLLQVAIPASIGLTVSSIGFAIMNAFVISYGESTLAAFSLGNRITSLVMMPIFGLTGALAAFVGQNIGAKQFKRAKKAVLKTLLFGFALLVLGSVFLYFIKSSVVRIFITDSEEVIQLSLAYMNILCFIFPLMAIFQSFVGAFQGSGHTKYVLALTLSRLWILRIPMIILFGKYTDWGSNGVWYAMLISNIFVSIIGYIIYLRGNWLTKTLRV